MFSGIVETMGEVIDIIHNNDILQLTVKPTIQLEAIQTGDSIAVNGVCLTVVIQTSTYFTTEIITETQRLTNLGNLTLGSQVNLERAITCQTRIGGHLVQGHIDGVATIHQIRQASSSQIILFKAPSTITDYLIYKGFVTIDGMSLTIAHCDKQTFTVHFIPHTQNQTIVKYYQVGDSINIEVDMTAKYIEKFLQRDAS